MNNSIINAITRNSVNADLANVEQVVKNVLENTDPALEAGLLKIANAYLRTVRYNCVATVTRTATGSKRRQDAFASNTVALKALNQARKDAGAEAKAALQLTLAADEAVELAAQTGDPADLDDALIALDHADEAVTKLKAVHRRQYDALVATRNEWLEASKRTPAKWFNQIQLDCGDDGRCWTDMVADLRSTVKINYGKRLRRNAITNNWEIVPTDPKQATKACKTK